MDDASARLLTPEGAEALDYLANDRLLTPETIRSARLGWTPEVRLPTAKGGHWTARGWTIPWFDGDRLAMVNLRRPDSTGPKYVHAYRDRPTIFMGTQATTRPGMPLVVTEGEFDALLLGQELADLAVVVTLGSASAHPEPTVLDRLGRYHPWHTAHDSDPSGDKSAARWPARSRRVRPPIGKDWTEAAQAGVNLRRWWSDRLGGTVRPEAFPWTELSARRWGPATNDPEPGIIIDHPDPDRRALALQSYVVRPADAIDPTTGISVTV